jgi:endonuclease/exonuclease/phosphatase family metal-dependent hydrolase
MPMIAHDFLRQTIRMAPWTARIAAAFLLVSATTGCGKKNDHSAWDSAGEQAPAAGQAAVPAQATAPDSPTPAPRAPSNHGLRFIAYNVENWLTMDRYVDNKLVANLPKPESEKQAVVKLLVAHAPDVIGLCEIGQASDLAEIQEMLKAAGLDMPHSHYTGGSDPVRHLGLLSRFPVTATARPAETDFRLQGRTFSINRGILDATVSARGKSYRFLGVHFKSKRPIEEADQEEIRIHEARLLRRHVDGILRRDARARLVVYGDVNDTRPTPAFKTLTGSYNDPGYLTALPLKDSRGHAWTHHWAPHDIYSRIDFITVSRSLRPEVDFRASYIIDHEDWASASDHRALLAIFK